MSGEEIKENLANNISGGDVKTVISHLVSQVLLVPEEKESHATIETSHKSEPLDINKSDDIIDESSNIPQETTSANGKGEFVLDEAPTQESDFLDDILKEAEVKQTFDSESDDSNDSSSDEDSDESSSGSSSDDGDGDIIQQGGGDSDGEEDETSGTPITSKNEVVNEPAPLLPDNFKIEEGDAIEEIGMITGVVENSIIIKGNLSGEFRFLKEGSVLCLEDRTPLGYLFEIFGPLAHPLYRIKFNSDEELKKFTDIRGKNVCYVVPKSNFVYTDSIKAIKGSDASNWNDEEIPEDEQEFSDDEKEMESKKNKNKKKRSRKNKEGGKTDEANKETEPATKGHNRQKQERKPRRNHQTQQNFLHRPQQEPNSSFGYQSRSQREQRAQPARVQLQNQYYQVQPAMFQPPPQMATPTFSFPTQIPNPMPAFQQNMNPQQWQQFYQMQQMMMQQLYAAQAHQGQFQPSQFQQPPQNPPQAPQNPQNSQYQNPQNGQNGSDAS